MPLLAETVLEAAGIGGWELDIATGKLRWTEVTYRLYDLDKSFEPTIEAAIGFYAPDVRAVISSAVATAIETGAPFDLELPLTTARGRNIRVRTVGRAVRKRGKAAKLVGAVEDVTARHELAAREARLSVVAEQMNNVVMMVGRDGRTEWVNPAFTRLTGYTIEDMRGHFPGEVLDGPETDPTTVRYLQACMRAGVPYEAEILNYAKDGRKHWMSVVGTPIRDDAGAITGFISVETEITATRELATLAARLALVARQMNNVVLVLDRAGRTEWVNDAFTRTTGWTLDEVKGRMPGDFLIGPSTDRSVADAIRECIHAGAPFEADLLTYGKDGRSRMKSVVGTPMLDAAGAVVGFIAVETDITEQRAAEEQLRREVAERARVETLLRDVLDALPSAITAYDSDGRFIVANRAYAEMLPIAASFSMPGRTQEEVMRLAVEHGQYPEAPTDPAEREAWFAARLRSFRAGAERTTELPDGRMMHAVVRRSVSGTIVTVRTDTTDLHAAEQMARREANERARAEALLRDILDTLPSAVTAFDAEDRFILANRSAQELFPITTKFSAPGRKRADTLRLAAKAGQYTDAPTDPAELEAWIAKRVGEVHDGTPRDVRLPDGRILQVRERRSETGALVAVRTDVSSLHRAEGKALREAAERERAEALLRDVLDALPSAVTAYDAEERFVFANRVYAEMFPISARFAVPGRAREEVVRLAAEHGQYGDAPPTKEAREAWVAGQLAQVRSGAHRTLRLGDGRLVQMLEGHSTSGMRVTVRTDVTELHRAQEQALREAAERERAEGMLRDVLDALPNVVTAYDADERFVMANRVFAELYPIAARFAVPGRPRTELFRLAAEHGQYGDLPEAPAERERWFAEQVSTWRAEPERVVRLSSGRVLQVREGRSTTGINVSVATDTTDLYRAEEKARSEAAERARAQALLQDVLDTLPNGVTAFGADERLVLKNRAYGELVPTMARFADLGVDLRTMFRLGATHGHFVEAPREPEALEAWIEGALRHMRSGADRVVHTKEGRFLQVRTIWSNTGYFVNVLTDVTDLTRAKALMQDVLDTLPTAVTAFDAEDRLILENRAVKEMFPVMARLTKIGQPRAETIRLAVETGQYADAPTDQAGREAWIAERLASKQDSTPRVLRLKGDRIIQVRERRSETGTLVVVRTDITDQTRAEVLLRDVLDTLPHAIVAYDREDRVILTNRAFAELFPITAGFIEPGRAMDEVFRLGAIHGQYIDAPQSPEALEPWIADAVANFRSGERWILRLKDGRIVQTQGRRSDSGTLVSVRTDVTELTRAEALLRDILEALPSGVIAYDQDERMVLWNSAAADLYPHVAEFAAVGRKLEDIMRYGIEKGQYADASDSPEEREEWIADQIALYRAGRGSRTIRLADGRFAQARERRSESGNLVCIRTETTDLVRTQALLRDVLDALPSAVTAYDADERLILTNRAYTEIFPIASRFARLGSRLEDTLRLAMEHGQFPDAGETPEERREWLVKRLAAHRNPGNPRTVRLPDGRYVQARESRSETGVTVCIRTDTTELTRAEQTMRFQAERDPLTALANRTAFLSSLDSALSNATSQSGNVGALFLLDIDYFKQINDTLGHDQGDALLIEIAARLRACLRVSDVPARLGGDEFGVLMPGLQDLNALPQRLDEIHAALSAPIELASRRLRFGVSLGVTTFPGDGTDPAVLLKNADLALYEAKRNGRGRWAAFRSEQAKALDDHNRVADALRDALAHDQIGVAYQPKRWLRAGGGHAGFEALARWHDGRRWVPPTEFIPVAEATGLIGQLGRVVMAASLRRAREIRDEGLDPGRVAVNVTSQQLLDAHFKDEVLAMLAQFGLRPVDLELEITETVLLGRASERIDAVLREFNDLGITLALDDFGTGYASLAHLSRLPIDRLKIDRSFVEGIGTGGPGGVITRTVVSLARSLGMESIAEGVETKEQMDFLENAGCDAGQGYLFSRPLLTTQEAVAYLRSVDEPPDGRKIRIDRISLH